MCEQVKGTFDFGEYERQYEAVTNGTGMQIMPILLRYYQEEDFPWAIWREAAWAGNTTCPRPNCSASCTCRTSDLLLIWLILSWTAIVLLQFSYHRSQTRFLSACSDPTNEFLQFGFFMPDLYEVFDVSGLQ